MMKRGVRDGVFRIVLVILLILLLCVWVYVFQLRHVLLLSPVNTIPSGTDCVWPPTHTASEVRNIRSGYIGWAYNDDLINVTYLKDNKILGNYLDERLLCYDNRWQASINEWSYFKTVVGYDNGDSIGRWRVVSDDLWKRKWTKLKIPSTSVPENVFNQTFNKPIEDSSQTPQTNQSSVEVNQSNTESNQSSVETNQAEEVIDYPSGEKIWYVRPLIYASQYSNGQVIPNSNIYGVQNGSSYGNAWNGLKSVVWGENGVKAGDTLYVCGTHIYQTGNINYIADQGNIVIGASGTEENPITIRMDCLGDKGIVWGVFKDDSNNVRWNGPNSDGVYWTSDLRYGGVVEFTGTDYVWLTKMEDSSLDNKKGAYYLTFRSDEPWLTDKTYVKTTNGEKPDGRIYSPALGYVFDLQGNSYINFYKCNLYGSVIRMNRARDFTQVPNHITIDSCDIKYSLDYGALINLYKGNDYWIIRNSELSYATNAIYTKTQDGIPGPRYLTVDSNYIHDIGVTGFEHQDSHAIGIQGGSGHVIQSNIIENTGAAIEFWSSADSMENMTVRNNFIKNIKVKAITGGSGIVISGDRTSEGRRTGFKIYNNVIMNTGIGAVEDWQGFGISSNNQDSIDVYNNVLYNNSGGIRLSPRSGFVKGNVYNNIIANPRQWGYAKIRGNKLFFNWDNNLYYPARRLDDTGLEGVYSSFGLRDRNSIVADPLFVSSNPQNAADFQLQVNSPAINEGRKVGLRFSGSAPDMGAWEVA